MFGSYFRPYIPGLWVDPQDSTSGFNVTGDGLTSPVIAPAGTSQVDAVPAQENEFGLQAAPFADLPDFQLYPEFNLPNFDFGGSGSTQSPFARADGPPSGAVSTPEPRTPRHADLFSEPPGLHLYSPDEVPSLDVELPDDAPGFDLPGDSVGQEDPVWSEKIPPIDEEAIPPALPRFPDELGGSATPVPSILGVLDPLTGRGGAVSPLPATVPAGQWSPPSLLQWPPATFAPSRSSVGYGMGRQPWNFMAYWNPWAAPSTAGPIQAQGADFQLLQNINVPRLHPDIGAVPGIKPAIGPNFALEDRETDVSQQAAPSGYAQRQPLAPPAFAATAISSPTKPSAVARIGDLGQGLPRFATPTRPLSGAIGNTDKANLIGQVPSQVQGAAAVARIDLSPRDAAGLPIGTAISTIRAPNASAGGNAAVQRLIQDYANTREDAQGDLSIHLVGDEDSVRGLSPRERHKLAIRPSVEMHIKRGFELVTDDEYNAIIPGFPDSPRRYDYIIKDPVTGKYFGVEVKTTIGATIRLRTQQVLKDVVVAVEGADVPGINIRLDGVAYTTLCFGCEELDVRSWVLLRILHNMGVKVYRVPYPGVMQP